MDADLLNSPESNSVEPASLAALANGDLQVFTKRLTNPTVVTISDVVTIPGSSGFDVGVGQTIGGTTGFGHDDTTTYARPHAGYVPPFKGTRGATMTMGMGR